MPIKPKSKSYKYKLRSFVPGFWTCYCYSDGKLVSVVGGKNPSMAMKAAKLHVKCKWVNKV